MDKICEIVIEYFYKYRREKNIFRIIKDYFFLTIFNSWLIRIRNLHIEFKYWYRGKVIMKFLNLYKILYRYKYKFQMKNINNKHVNLFYWKLYYTKYRIYVSYFKMW